jgi:hypothetical protein
MDNKTFNKIWDHLQNYEAQYTSLTDVINYIKMFMPKTDDKNIEFVYGKYMTHCINNNLI